MSKLNVDDFIIRVGMAAEGSTYSARKLVEHYAEYDDCLSKCQFWLKVYENNVTKYQNKLADDCAKQQKDAAEIYAKTRAMLDEKFK